jgi:hypothetical protein
LGRGEEEVIVFDLPSSVWTEESLSIPACENDLVGQIKQESK